MKKVRNLYLQWENISSLSRKGGREDEEDLISYSYNLFYTGW
mgnify:CR=1 FL=1